MSSLYNISNDILRIFNEVEQAEGEITDEQYNDLCIKQEELRDKLDAYVKAIKTWQVDEQALKDEMADQMSIQEYIDPFTGSKTK